MSFFLSAPAPVPASPMPQPVSVLKLRRFALFQGLSDALLGELAALAAFQKAYPGQTILEEGEPAREVVLLLKGQVRLQVESISPNLEIAIGKLEAGEVLGEMALLSDDVRSTTVVALKQCDMVVLPAEPVRALIEQNPDEGILLLRNAGLLLARRLRTMNRRMINYVRNKSY